MKTHFAPRTKLGELVSAPAGRPPLRGSFASVKKTKCKEIFGGSLPKGRSVSLTIFVCQSTNQEDGTSFALSRPPAENEGCDQGDGEQCDDGSGGSDARGGLEGARGRGDAEEDQAGGDDFAVWLDGK